MTYRKNLVFAAACVGMLLFGISLLSLGSLLPSIAARFHLDGIATGALVSVLPFGLLGGSMVFGPLVDRFGYKLLLLLSALVVIAGLEAIALAPSLALLRVAILAIGFAGGMLNGGTNALVADISTDDRGAKLSLLGVFFGVGALGMPVLLGTLRGVEHSTILMGIGAALLLPVLYLGLIAFPEPKHAQGVPLAEGLALLKDGALMSIALTLALQSGIEGVVSNWSTTYLQGARGLESGDALFALSACVGAMTVTRLVLSGVLQKIPGGRVLFGGMGLTAIGLVVIAYAPNAAAAGAGLAMMGAGLAAAFPMLMGYAADLYPRISGTAFSVVLAIALPGNMLLNYLMGVLSDWAGVRALPLYLSIALAMQLGLAVAAVRAYQRRMRAA